LKYTISYKRKVKISDDETVEIGLVQELDDSLTPQEIGFTSVRNNVDAWIKEEVSKLSKTPPKESAPTEKEKPKTITVDAVSKAFPQELRGKLYFEDTENHVIVRARHYLEPATFKQIADIVTERFGGEYISAGRDSHFRIEKNPA